MSRHLMTGVVLLSLAFSASGQAAVTLTEDGTVQATVVCDAEADRPAAEEFVSVVERITGASLPIASQVDAQGPRVLIGEAAVAVFSAAVTRCLAMASGSSPSRLDVIATANSV